MNGYNIHISINNYEICNVNIDVTMQQKILSEFIRFR